MEKIGTYELETRLTADSIYTGTSVQGPESCF